MVLFSRSHNFVRLGEVEGSLTDEEMFERWCVLFAKTSGSIGCESFLELNSVIICALKSRSSQTLLTFENRPVLDERLSFSDVDKVFLRSLLVLGPHLFNLAANLIGQEQSSFDSLIEHI
jgi:hypothetical protein